MPVAHGNDMGGSIRFPASMCGIVGLKPSRARTTLGPDFGEYWGPLTHEFVLTRSIRDTAAVLDAVAGAGTGDPYTAPPPLRPYREEVGAAPGRLHIGFRTRQRNGEPSHPDCAAAVEQAAQLLETLGHDVEAVDIPALDTPIDHAFGTVMGVAIARDVARWSSRLGRDITPELEPTNAFIANSVHVVTAASTSTRSTTCRRGRARCRRGGTTPRCWCCRRARSLPSGSASSPPTTSKGWPGWVRSWASPRRST